MTHGDRGQPVDPFCQYLIVVVSANADWLGPETKDDARHAPRDIEKILDANPPGEREGPKVTTLYVNPRCKHVLAQVRDREAAHVLTDSDITAWLRHVTKISSP